MLIGVQEIRSKDILEAGNSTYDLPQHIRPIPNPWFFLRLHRRIDVIRYGDSKLTRTKGKNVWPS